MHYGFGEMVSSELNDALAEHQSSVPSTCTHKESHNSETPDQGDLTPSIAFVAPTQKYLPFPDYKFSPPRLTTGGGVYGLMVDS